MKSTITLLTIAFTLSLTTATAQWAVDNKEDVELVRNSVLAVVAFEKDEKLAKKLGKELEELKEYEEGIRYFNATLKEILQKEWKSSKEIKFVSESDAQKLEEARDTKHCILRLAELAPYKMGDFYSPNSKSGFNKPADLHYHMSSTGKLSALEITPASSTKKKIVLAHLPSIGITYASIKFMVQYMQQQMDDCVKKDITKYGKMKDDVETRNSLLKNKTLLLYDPMISKNLRKSIDDKSLAKDYPYQYEVVDITRLNEIVKESKDDYAYIISIPSGAVMNGITMHQYCIVNAGDGKLLFLSDKSVAGAVGQFHEYHFKLIAKSLK